MPSLPEILVKALEDLLDKPDPLRKAERAKARTESMPSPEKGDQRPTKNQLNFPNFCKPFSVKTA